MDEYIHLRQQARDVFEMRHRETIDPIKNPWELCSRVLARSDVIDRHVILLALTTIGLPSAVAARTWIRDELGLA